MRRPAVLLLEFHTYFTTQCELSIVSTITYPRLSFTISLTTPSFNSPSKFLQISSFPMRISGEIADMGAGADVESYDAIVGRIVCSKRLMMEVAFKDVLVPNALAPSPCSL